MKRKIEINSTLHDLMDDLTKTLNLDPEQQFRVTAKIKRYVHCEKIGVYARISEYASWGKYRKAKSKRVKNKAKLDSARWIKEFAESKVKGHIQLAKSPDEHIVTWNVGSHRYNP